MRDGAGAHERRERRRHGGADDARLEAAETSATLDHLLDTLSDRYQLVLRLRFREDLTQTEIARRIGCSQMQVSRIQRAALAQLVQNATTTPSDLILASTTPAGQEDSWPQTAAA